jgi:hypothetical protein
MGHGDRRKCILTHVIAVTNFTVRRLIGGYDPD